MFFCGNLSNHGVSMARKGASIAMTRNLGTEGWPRLHFGYWCCFGKARYDPLIEGVDLVMVNAYCMEGIG